MATKRDWRCEDPKQQLVWAAATGDAIRVLEGKWKLVIIYQLFAAKRPLRFSELERLVEGANQKMLIQQLKVLEKDGIVTRTVYAQVPPKVEYTLSEMGIPLGPALAELVRLDLHAGVRCSPSVPTTHDPRPGDAAESPTRRWPLVGPSIPSLRPTAAQSET